MTSLLPPGPRGQVPMLVDPALPRRTHYLIRWATTPTLTTLIRQAPADERVRLQASLATPPVLLLIAAWLVSPLWFSAAAGVGGLLGLAYWLPGHRARQRYADSYLRPADLPVTARDVLTRALVAGEDAIVAAERAPEAMEACEVRTAVAAEVWRCARLLRDAETLSTDLAAVSTSSFADEVELRDAVEVLSAAQRQAEAIAAGLEEMAAANEHLARTLDSRRLGLVRRAGQVHERLAEHEFGSGIAALTEQARQRDADFRDLH